MNAVITCCVIVAVAFATTPDTASELKASFEAVDPNHDGKLSVAEFLAVYDRYDKNDHFIKRKPDLAAAVHADVCLSLEDCRTPDTASELKASFEAVDPNHDGKLSVAEFLAVYDRYDKNDSADLHWHWNWQIKEITRQLHFAIRMVNNTIG